MSSHATAATSRDQRRKRHFLGSYEIMGKPLGRGGMATVWRARDPGGRDVALKELNATAGVDRQLVRRFRQEFDILARLDHPHIVKVHRLLESEGTLAIVMESVDGLSVRDVLRVIKPLPVGAAVAIGARVALALAHAHARGILHRDVKPSNILLGHDGRVRLADFGVARAPEGVATRAGALLGTPAYLAPEQLAGARDLGPSADLYSLGIVMLEMLTGRSPFGKPSTDIVRMVESRRTPPSALIDQVADPRLRLLIASCLAASPNERPSGAAEAARLMLTMEPTDVESAISALVARAREGRHLTKVLVTSGGRGLEAALQAASVLATVLFVLSMLVYAPQVVRRVSASLGHALPATGEASGVEPPSANPPGGSP